MWDSKRLRYEAQKIIGFHEMLVIHVYKWNQTNDIKSIVDVSMLIVLLLFVLALELRMCLNEFSY